MGIIYALKLPENLSNHLSKRGLKTLYILYIQSRVTLR